MGEPYFPPPGTGSRTAYREQAERPLGAAASAAPEGARRVVVTASRAPAPRAREAADVELHPYWSHPRFRTFARFPRVFGAVLSAGGAYLSWAAQQVLLHGGTYTTRSASMGPFVLATGLFLLAVGFPRDARMRPPSWWIAGIFLASAVGMIAGFALLFAIER